MTSFIFAFICKPRSGWIELIYYNESENSFQFSYRPFAYTKSLRQLKKTKNPKPLLFPTSYLWAYVYTERRRRRATIGSQLTQNFTVCQRETMINLPCESDEWTWRCSISLNNCVYLYTCDLNKQKLAIDCTEVRHDYNSIVCCNPGCEAGN